jgi:Flp pilus assembly secretin CpaC
MSMKHTALAFVFAVVMATVSLARAADRTIILAIGTEGTTLMLERPFKTVLIGDPAVVDVLTEGNRWALLQPQGLGGTNIVFLDEGNIAIANVRVLVCDSAAKSTALDDRSGCEPTGAAGRSRS